MKIEKINENQIKFTLNRDDLASRQLRISELAYGSEKARALFSELMHRASTEVGFEAEDLPVMIEAIPMSQDSLVLVVTKVEDPEELDARFSSFSSPKKAPVPRFSSADEILSCFDHLEEILQNLNREQPAAETEQPSDGVRDEIKEARAVLARIYVFDNLAGLKKLAGVLSPFYKGNNTLYKDPRSGYYFLVLQIGDHSPADFNKVCNIVAEYGDPAKTTYATTSYFEEHFQLLIKNNALAQIAKL